MVRYTAVQTEKQKEFAVQIARDILKQIKSNTLLPRQLTYGRFNEIDVNELVARGTQHSDSYQKVLTKLKHPCQACAIGSMFLAKVRLKNKVNVGDIYHPGPQSDSMRRHLKDAFTLKQLHDIENLFENSNMFETGFNRAKHWRFYHKYNTPEKILTWIANSIIRNKGEFKLPKENKKYV